MQKTSSKKKTQGKNIHPTKNPIARPFDADDHHKVHHGDARLLSTRLPDKSVDVTITSPPYFDLKDYGNTNQIGYGQAYPNYLEDLAKVFSQIYRATKDHGSLWVVIDTFRQNREVLPLPFDLASQIKPIGWTLRDVIIWKKERTLPWAHKGKTKKIFEYILVFAKGKNPFRYYPDKFRDISELKRWWVRYPERYNPKGKALEEIWNFDIPTQGSWGKKYVSHFCPLPEDLVSRIIDLTTRPGDMVLDPFSGSGTVPAQADLKGRNYLGFELNSSYIKMFLNYLRTERQPPRTNSGSTSVKNQKQFEQLVLDLRVLKFGRQLHKALSKTTLVSKELRILVRRTAAKPKAEHKVCSAEYTVLTTKNTTAQSRRLNEEIAAICSKRPLSKFGVEQTILVKSPVDALPALWRKRNVFVYTQTNSHKYRSAMKLASAIESGHPIISNIGVNVEEPDD